ncbi:cyclic lactone autoinducer peptide [Enterococcus innesii]|nr:cyclic lactone autoinducer peptide [Enterococcus innesii]
MKKTILIIIKVITLMLASSVVNFTCAVLFYQPKLSEEVKRLRKF